MRLLPLGVLVPAAALKIASNLQWIEHTPLPYTNNLYAAGPDRPVLADGGVVSLSDTSDTIIGANSETQGLKQYATHKNYRLIYVLVEVTYRLVASRASGVQKLSDLKGKKIGTFNGTSAEVFVRALLSNAELEVGTDYTLVNTLVNGSMCMRAPCGPGTLPAMLKRGEIDAFGCWETAPELAIEDLGEAGVSVFKNATLFREIYSLYATAEALADTEKRAQIVRYIKSVNETLELFKKTPEEVLPFVSNTINVPETVLGKVWKDHVWGPGSLGKDLIDFLEMEEKYLSNMDSRAPASRADLEKFVDASVYEDALKL